VVPLRPGHAEAVRGRQSRADVDPSHVHGGGGKRAPGVPGLGCTGCESSRPVAHTSACWFQPLNRTCDILVARLLPLKAPGFNPWTSHVISWWQYLAWIQPLNPTCDILVSQFALKWINLVPLQRVGEHEARARLRAGTEPRGEPVRRQDRHVAVRIRRRARRQLRAPGGDSHVCAGRRVYGK
jgi:hypothetical protein